MQLKRFLLMIALLSGSAFAQTTSTITGTIKDLTGALVTSGKITFTLRPSTDATMSGIARFTGQTITCLINASGLVKAQDGVSACVITMNTALQPAGSGYLVSFWPGNVKTATIFMYAISSSIDITTVVSTQAQLPSAGGVVDTFTNQTIGGNKTFSGTVTLSNSVNLASPTSTGTDNGTETLQNKTLQSPTSTGTDNGAETLQNKTLQSPVSTGTDNGAETLQNKTIQNLNVAGGVNFNGAGFKHARPASCTTAAAGNATCSITYTWTTAFADASYTAVVTLDNPSVGSGCFVSNTGAKTATQMSIAIYNAPGSALACNGTLNIIAVHD